MTASFKGIVLLLCLSIATLAVAKKAKRKDETAKRIEDALSGFCPATCEEGYIPGPRSGALPYANGCKVPDFNQLKGNFIDYRHFDTCCNLHNICYMTCGSTKKFCDAELEKCMKAKCERRNDEEMCMKTTNEFVIGYKMHGCKNYVESQQYLCACFRPEEAQGRVAEYAHEFFAVFNKTHMLPDSISKRYLEGEPNSERHGELLFRLYKKYPDAIDIVARDGKTKRSKPRVFSSVQGTVPDEEDDEHDEL